MITSCSPTSASMRTYRLLPGYPPPPPPSCSHMFLWPFFTFFAQN
jgi:hypothetical protein